MTVLNPTSITGRVEALLVNPDAADESIETHATDQVEVSFEGLVGDRHAAMTCPADVRYRKQYSEGTPIRNARQVSIVSLEELAEVAGRMGIADLQPQWLGANIALSGIPSLTLLPPSTRLLFSSGASLVVDNENRACRFPAEVIETHHPDPQVGFVRAAREKRGLVAWVEKQGHISLGDDVAVHLPPLRLYPHA